jgi:hypothetical protein
MSMQHTLVERPFKAAMPAFERAFFVAQADSLRESVMHWRALATEPPCVSMRGHSSENRMLTHGGSVALFALWGSLASCSADFIGALRALVLRPNRRVGNRTCPK